MKGWTSPDTGILSPRCALESFGSAAHPQKRPCERELSQLTYPEASVSRLTYVSQQESISPSVASGRGLDDREVSTSVTSLLTLTSEVLLM